MANTSITTGQRKQAIEVVSVAAANAVIEALGTTGLQKPALQRILARGGGLQKSLTPHLVGLMRSYAVEFDPASFIARWWSIDPDDEQLLSAPLDIDLDAIEFLNTLRPGETTIKGEENWRRLRDACYLCLNADHFKRHWALGRQDRLPEKWKNIGYIRYEATKLRSPRGFRYVLYLYWQSGAWGWDYDWLFDGFSAQDQSGVAGKY